MKRAAFDVVGGQVTVRPLGQKIALTVHQGQGDPYCITLELSPDVAILAAGALEAAALAIRRSAVFQVMQAAGSGPGDKDGVKAVNGAGSLGDIVANGEVHKPLVKGNEEVNFIGFEHAVDRAGGVPKGNPVESGAAAPRAGLELRPGNGGQYLFVVGERRYTFDDLRVHELMSPRDASYLGYFVKYISRLAASVEARDSEESKVQREPVRTWKDVRKSEVFHAMDGTGQ